MYTKIYEPRYGDFKDFNTIKVGSLLDFVQDIAIKDSEAHGYSIHTLKELGLSWLLQGITVDLLQPLRTSSPIFVSTAVKKMRGVISERGCLVYQNDELVARTIANWFLFNTEKMQISRISPEMLSAYPEHNFNDPFFEFKKPTLLEIDVPEYAIRIGTKDIDTNLHLNNQKAADLLMDALPLDFHFNRMNLLFKKAAYHGEILQVYRKKTEHGFYVHLKNDSKGICVAGLFESFK